MDSIQKNNREFYQPYHMEEQPRLGGVITQIKSSKPRGSVLSYSPDKTREAIRIILRRNLWTLNQVSCNDQETVDLLRATSYLISKLKVFSLFSVEHKKGNTKHITHRFTPNNFISKNKKIK